jgi:hypothetical protein
MDNGEADKKGRVGEDFMGSLKLLRGLPWEAVFFMLPFCFMIVVHKALGLSDALMVATPPGERAAHEYNLVMVLSFHICAAAVALHIVLPSQRSFLWITLKVLLLAAVMALGLATL